MGYPGAVVMLGLLAVGAWGQGALPNVARPPCDSPEAEAAALVAQDFLNAQHAHGYKYALNQIEDIKIITKPDGSEQYILEIELLETKCHVLEPTPVANCTVRPKAETKVEADCDVILLKADGVFSVSAFKCKTEVDSAEDTCVGCPVLLPLNHTDALAVVFASLDIFNNKTGNETLFTLLEVGRLTSQVVSGEYKYFAEYVIGETNCTADENYLCVPLHLTGTQQGFCVVEGSTNAFGLNCRVFVLAMTPITANDTAPTPPPLHHPPHGHGFKHHKLTTLHNPELHNLLSESDESAETPVGTMAPALKLLVKRQAVVPADPAPAETPAVQPVVLSLVPVCPGKIKHF